MNAAAEPNPAHNKPAIVETKGALQRKWGAKIMAAGFTGVPDLLLRRMGKLGLSPTEMIVLLQIMTYWWDRERLPYPSKQTIAAAIGCKAKNVQKAISRLVNTGFINRIERPRAGNRHDSNVYDFSPLIALLEPEAEEEAQKIAEAKVARAARDDRMRRRGRPTLNRVK